MKLVRNKMLPSAIEIVPFSKYTECPPPPNFIIGDLVVEKGVTLVVGAAGIGKSTLALNAALSVANGGSFLGWACERGDAIFVNPELSSDAMARRAWQMSEALGYPTPDMTDRSDNLCGNLHLLNLRGTANSLDIIGKRASQLCEQKKLSPKLIVFDSLYMLASGDENDAANVTKNLLAIGRIAEETGAGVIVTHHTTKGSQSGKSVVDRASGSGAFGRYVDALAYLGRLDAPETEAGSAWRLEFGKTRHTATPTPINLRLAFPLHIPDTDEVLNNANYAEDVSARHGDTASDRERKLLDVFELLSDANSKCPTIEDLATEMHIAKTTVERWIKTSKNFEKFKPEGEKAHRVRRLA